MNSSNLCNKLNLWILNISPLKNEDVFSKYYSIMPKSRKNKIDELNVQIDKYLSLGAGYLIFKLLSEFSSNEDECYFNENGKLYHKNVFFNVSHSGDYVVLLFSSKQEVGVDIQKNRNLNSLITREICSSEEIEQYNKVPKEAQNEYLLNLFCKKEAYLKCLSLGIRKKLNSFSVNSADNCLFFETKLEGYQLISCIKNNSFLEELNVEFIKL